MKTNQATFTIITIFIAIFTIVALNKPALADDTPPTFVDITGNTSGTTGETVTLEAVVEDDVGVTEVVFYIGTPEIAETAMRVSQVQVQGTYRVVVLIPSNSADDIPYYVEATDTIDQTTRAPEVGTFTITVTDDDAPIVVVTRPNGGELLGIGLMYDILWTAEDNIGVTGIDLYYSTDNGDSWNEIAINEPNDGIYTWEVPDDPTEEGLIKVVAHDVAGNDGEDTSDDVFTMKIIQVPYPFADDFESGVRNWDLEGFWGLTTEEAHSGDYSLTDSPDAFYDNNTDTSAMFNISFANVMHPVLTYWEKYNLALGDFTYVQLSKDNGATWETVAYRGGSPPLVGELNEWTQRRIDLGRNYDDQERVLIRFRLKADGSIIDRGWFIDDVSLDENFQTFAFPFFDDMESEQSDDNWVSTSNSLTSVWARIETDAHSGDYVWTDSPYGNYGNNVVSTLRLNGVIDLSQSPNPQLSFWHRYWISTWDYARVYASGDGGQTFQKLTEWGYGTQSAYTPVRLDLSAYAGNPNVVILFQLTSDSSGQANGWYIDHVSITNNEELLHPPENITPNSMDLSWDETSYTDIFLRYELYRNTNENFTFLDGVKVTSIPDISTTSFHDDNLEFRRTYYYKLYVVFIGEFYNGGGNVVSGTTLPVAPLPFSDDFENGASNWYLGGTWGLTTEEAHSGEYSLTDSPDALYKNNADMYASTGFDMSEVVHPVLTFWEKYDLAVGDFTYVQISKDNGVTWETVAYRGGSPPLVGHLNEWTQRRIDLGRNYNGEEQVLIRFRLKADGASIDRGWFIDDVSIDENFHTFAFPFFDDMESSQSDDNWVSASNSITSVWARIETDAHSGDYAWTDSPYGNYSNNVVSTLRLNGVIDLSQSPNPQLSFWHRYWISTWDYARVYASGDGGQTFQKLTEWGYGTQSAYTPVRLNLSAYAGNPNVVILFQLTSDSSGQADGWYIDDIYIGENISTMVDWGNLDSPDEVLTDVGVATENIYGLVYEQGITDSIGQGAGIIAQLGYGPDESLPWVDAWTWVDAAYDSDVDDQPGDFKFDKYATTLTVDTPGTYDYAYRYQLESETTWVYADLDGNNFGSETSNGYSPSQAGDLMVGVGTKPIITNLSPLSGPVGTLVTVTGENFGGSQDGSTVTINDLPQEIVSWSDAEISITVVEGTTTGPVIVTVGGQASNDDKIFTVISPTAPVITSISPSIGPVGTPVTITGENFGDSQDGSTVTFNGVDAGVASCWTNTKILIIVPPGATTGPVVVTVGGQASNDDKIFTIGEVPPCSFADIDGDCDVDIVDIQKVAGRWNTGCGDGDYIPEYDVDGDGDIDIVDIQQVAGCWGTVLPCATGVVATNALELKPASPVQVSIQPRLQKLTISGTAMIEVKIENVSDLGAFEVTLGYDNSVVQLAAEGIQLGDFLSSSGRTVAAVASRIDRNQGTFSYGAFSFGESPGPDSGGILARIPLTAKDEGQTMLKLMGVKLTDTDGKPIDVGKVKHGLVKVVPQETALAPNFPNPFNPDTWIPYQLSKDARVIIELYSVSGKLIRVLDLGYKEAGFYTQKSNAAYWNGRNQVGEKIASGVYFYHLKAGKFHATRKLLVTK